MPERTNQVRIIRQNKWYRLWLDPKTFNPNDPLSFEHGFDISLVVDFDNDTLSKNNDNLYEVSPQSFSINENIVKFKTGEEMAFKDFWNACLDKINGIISSIGKFDGFLTAETERATSAEKTLRVAIATLEKNTVGKTTLPDAVIDVQLENRAEVVNIKIKSRDTNSGQDTTAIFPLPVASTEHVGLMNPETFRAVGEHEKRLAAIEGRAERWPVRLAAENVTQAQYQAAYEQVAKVPAGTVPPDGTTLDNLTNNHLIKYYTNTPTGSSDHWIDRGVDTVGQASNETAGIVQGDATTPGKIFVEPNGTMSVNGWDSAIAEVRAAAANATENARIATEKATSATQSASNAATSATNAASSATSANTAKTSAVAAESAAKDSETAAAGAAATAKNWATKMNGPVDGTEYSAKYYAASAAESESGAQTSETNAFNSATAAQNNATAASESASSAASSATAAAQSAATAQQNEQLLQDYVSQASTSATAAQTAATSASGSATQATNSANAAATSANESAGSAANARTYELAAGTSASEASASATAANNSQVAASGSADSAATAATSAANSATAASTSATNASTSATNAANSADSAAASATAAQTAKSAAVTSQQAAAQSATAAQQSEQALSAAVTSAGSSATAAATSATEASASATSAANARQEVIEYLASAKNDFVTKDILSAVYKKLTGNLDYGSLTDPVTDGENLDYGEFATNSETEEQ